MSEPLLFVENLEVVYGHAVRAIQGVSFSVDEGSSVGLVGLNGAGKTTTIRAISGFLPTESVKVTDGQIRFKGQFIVGWHPYQTARAGISVVPERDKVFNTLTVQENLEVALAATTQIKEGSRKRKGYSTLKEIYELFPSLQARAKKNAIYLSGGERQMLAIAATLLTNPRIMIVDEAALGLAPIIRQQVLDLLQDLNKELGLTVLIVDQDVIGVLSIAEYCYILEHGHVVFDGRSADLLQHGDVQEFYLGKAEGEERGYKNVKQYRRVRRWY